MKSSRTIMFNLNGKIALLRAGIWWKKEKKKKTQQLCDQRSEPGRGIEERGWGGWRGGGVRRAKYSKESEGEKKLRRWIE